jgi:hypothetical protein
MVIAANSAGVLLFGLFGVFSLLGTLAIDSRKQRVLRATEWR